MQGNARRSKAAAVATPRFSPFPNNITQGISNLSLSDPQAPERPRLWFLAANLPLPPHSQEGSSHSKKNPSDHVPRPRNLFILFRSHFIHQGVLPEGIAFYTNNNRVSTIVAHIWNVLPDEEKDRFYAMGDEEKRLHQALFPEYEITASSRKTKGQARNKSNMTPEKVTCKRIAEIVLQNIQGEELATQIRDVVGWFDQVSLSAFSRKKSTEGGDMDFDRIAEIVLQNIQGEELATQIRDVVGWFDQVSLSAFSRKKSTEGGDMDFDRIAPTSRAKPARKSNKGRANKPQSPPKTRSSSSKQKKSKATMKPPRSLVFDPSRRESFFSDNEWSGDLITDRNASYTSSEADLPLASITSGGISTGGSVDTHLHTPFRLHSPFPAGDAMGDLLSWDEDVGPQGVPFDQEVPFKAIDECVTHGEQYPDGWHENNFIDQSVYYEAHHGWRYEATQVPIGGLLTGNPVASPEPQTISPQCLF